MHPLVTELGVGFCGSILVLREVFNYLGRQKNKVEVPVVRLEPTTLKMIDDLHEWHNVNDSDGVKVWYVRHSLQEAIEKMIESAEAQTRVLQGMWDEIKDMRRDIKTG